LSELLSNQSRWPRKEAASLREDKSHDTIAEKNEYL
jgi:hypothetical protein